MRTDIISQVRKPSRYLGQEFNSIRKDPGQVKIRVALAFPDLYEVGMSNLGLKIIYHVLNQREEIWAERAFVPAPDLEELLRSRGVRLTSLESDTPLGDFDILGLAIPHELNLTGILNLLDLSGLPLRAEARGENFPLVLGGGGGVFNPEPIAPFFDAILIGEGETAILEICDRFLSNRKAGGKKTDLLRSLAEVTGVYVPAFFPEGARTPGRKIERAIVADLDEVPFPVAPVVPFTDIIHNRIVVEIARGCAVGCRFCQAGMVYRPTRERSPRKVLELVSACLDHSGYEEATLLSLSASDYSQLGQLLPTLNQSLAQRKLAFSLPSLRVRPLDPQILVELSRVKRGGITLAPEAGSERLRASLNKPSTDAEIVESVRRIFAAGWTAVKLYFMVGLPGETPADIEAIAALVGRIRTGAGRPGAGKNIRVSVGSFIPKAHTPFQWERMASRAELENTREILKKLLRRTGVEFKFHPPAFSWLEGILARGDRRMAAVIERAYRLGARLDSWKEYFRPELWEQAFREEGLTPDTLLGPLEVNDPLPWEHLLPGPGREFLIQEREKSRRGELTAPCLPGKCAGCGLCATGAGRRPEISAHLASIREPIFSSGPEAARPRAVFPEGKKRVWTSRYRLTFAKQGLARFLSQLELQQVFIRAIRRARLPVRYSEGFHPLPTLAFGPALPVGMEAQALCLDLELTEFRPPREILETLNSELPEGLKLTAAREIPLRTPSIYSQVSSAEYEIDLSRHPELAQSNPVPVIPPSAQAGSRGYSIVPLSERKFKLIIPFYEGRGEKPLRVLSEYWGIAETELSDLAPVLTRFELNEGEKCLPK